MQPALARTWCRGGVKRVVAVAACAAGALAGAWSFSTLDVETYLTHASPFVFVDFEAPLALRWAQWLAVGVLYALAGVGIWALLGRLERGGRVSGNRR